MPKERENSLCLGNNLTHTALVKRTVPAIWKEAHLDVFSVLKDLSNKSDVLAEHIFSEDPHLDDMFAAVKETMLLIRNCKTVKEIEYPPRRTFAMSNEKKAEEISVSVIKTATPERHIETPVVNLVTPSEKLVTPAEMFVTPSAKLVPTTAKTVTPARAIVTPSANKVTLAASSNQYSYPVIRLNKINVLEVNSSNKENYRRNDISTPQHLMQTPILNKTFEKINKTLTLDSKSASNSQNSNQKSKILNLCNNSVTKFENDRMLTRSGSKRKSSTGKNETNKKQKTEPHDISVMSSKRTVQYPTALCEKNTTRAAVLASEKSKVTAVIVPSLQPKISVISKEQQLLEELQKKEIKADQNRKKILAERQQKAEQSKKTREEKMTKTMQKRLQMEKLKEEKREAEAKKSQVKPLKENTKKTTRTKELIDQHSKENKSITTKELIDQHAKENKSMVLNAAKQSVVYAENIVKTPANGKIEVQSYDITPRADSSAYNFSEDEDEKPSGKPLPAWAQGGLLKSALLQQFYAPIDTDALFGSVIDTPNLAEIFKVNKKRYMKRTSSAVWNTPPNQCIR